MGPRMQFDESRICVTAGELVEMWISSEEVTVAEARVHLPLESITSKGDPSQQVEQAALPAKCRPSAVP